MDNKLFFSIICPTFNSSKFIEKNILSILNQTYSNFEIIYSDDGSSDDTLDVILKYKKLFLDKNIDITILKNLHKGPGASRNKAIIESKYDWISFIDSDDEWKLNKLEAVVNVIKKNNQYNCIAHNEFFRKINGSLVKFNYSKLFKITKPVYKQLFLKNFLSTSSITIKKKLIKDVDYFDETLANAQDYDLWLKIGNRFNLFFIDDYLGIYNERNNNITSLPYKKK